MADPITNAPPTVDIPQTPGSPTQQTVPGTNLNIPIGGGVERVITVPAPFQTNAPPWYSPAGTVWAQMGCAVPQCGDQLVCNNRVIWDFNNKAGKSLFNILWRFSPDRLSDSAPTYDCLVALYQLLIDARNRLVAKVSPDASSALRPTKATPAPRMFMAYPVPFYGPLGCVNQYLGEFAELVMRMQEEAMQHEDIAKDFFITQDFMNAVYPYLKYLLVDMATKFFGIDPKTAADDKFTIPDTAFQGYSRATAGGSFGPTSPAPPLNYVGPSDQDLSRIRGLTYELVVPFLQPWPDATYKVSSGGIWANSSSPAIDPTAKAGAAASGVSGMANLAATADPSIFPSKQTPNGN
jgi:hypothetical protein